ncbi:hypothetical protein DS421_19g646200 [Arachis hypogaea]|uniref:Uncharacterized protein n=1 Tax=Arachis hypogaea TaxID=3818 RepID=A0A6B9V5S7_ARAHY|nr:hypothetical protein DS421_19g646200 [Arachis hypogaea]
MTALLIINSPSILVLALCPEVFVLEVNVCLFSHQPKEDFATPSRVHNLGMKSPHFLGNTNSNMPPNIHGCGSIQQNHLIIPPRVHLDINSEHKATNMVQKQLKLASKGVSSVDVAKLSLPSPTTPKEGTTKVGSSSSDQST